MNKQLKIIIILLSVGIVLSIFALNLLGGGKQDDPVLAKVNGVAITQSQLSPLVQMYREKSRTDNLGQEEKLKILQGLIARQLMLQQKESEDIRKEERVVKQVKELEDRLVVSVFLEKHVGKNFVVTDEEIKEYYKQNLPKFASPPKVKARQIVLRNRNDANQVMEKLRKGGDFAQLAKEYSIDIAGAREGGSMGTIEKGRIRPELERAVFTLDVGELSDIVETPVGFHIVTVDERITTSYKPLNEVNESIKKAIMLEKESKAFDEMYEKLKKKAKVEIFEDRVQAAK